MNQSLFTLVLSKQHSVETTIFCCNCIIGISICSCFGDMDHKYVSVVFLLSWMFCIGDISGENPSVIHTCYVVVLVAVVFLLVFFFFFFGIGCCCLQCHHCCLSLMIMMVTMMIKAGGTNDNSNEGYGC